MKQVNRKSVIFETYKVHVGALRRFVGRMLANGGRHDVEDVVQEAFLLAWKAEGKQEIDQPRPFLFHIARNVALNHLRQKTRRPTDYLDADNPLHVPATDYAPEDELMAREKLEIHCAAVAALPPQCRKVYLMRKVYAMSYKEIAETLNITVSTVETHLEKAFARCEAYVDVRLQEGETKHRGAGRKQRL